MTSGDVDDTRSGAGQTGLKNRCGETHPERPNTA